MAVVEVTLPQEPLLQARREVEERIRFNHRFVKWLAASAGIGSSRFGQCV